MTFLLTAPKIASEMATPSLLPWVQSVTTVTLQLREMRPYMGKSQPCPMISPHQKRC